MGKSRLGLRLESDRTPAFDRGVATEADRDSGSGQVSLDTAEVSDSVLLLDWLLVSAIAQVERGRS